MKCCCKCKGEKFVKVAKSTVVPTLEFYLCECGNVMIKEAVLGDILFPTPENGPLANLMMKDAAKALGIPASLGYLKEEDIDTAANNFMELVEKYFGSEEAQEEECTCDDYDDCEDCSDWCEECESCEEFCVCVKEQDDLEDMVSFIDSAIRHANLDSKFVSLWNQAVANGEINKIVLDVINEKGFDIATLMEQKKQLLDIIPDEIRDEAMLAKLMGMILSKDLKDTCDKVDKEIERNSNRVSAMKDQEIREDRNTKSYVVLEKNGLWKLFKDKTPEEISILINEDEDIENFMIYEVKPVEIKEKVVFSIK